MNNPLLSGLTSGAAFLLSFLLFNTLKEKNEVANKWLGVFAATIGCAMMDIFIHNAGLQKDYHTLLSFMEACRFLTAPALYLSVLYFTTPNQKFQWAYLWHFTLFLLFFLLHVYLHLRGGIRFENNVLRNIFFIVIQASLPLQTVIYILLSYHKIIRHQKNIRQITSSVESIDLSWLKSFLIVSLFILVIWLNLAFFNFEPLYDLTPLLYLTGMYSLAYFSLRQQEIFAFNSADLREIETLITPRSERHKRLSDLQTTHLKNKLEDLMNHQKMFLENDLTLLQLAKKMEISVHDLSYLINESYHENFFSFINKYRIEEAKRLLLSEQYHRLNILGIAYQSGFNSKTTFNMAFKKHLGISPSEYVRSMKKNDPLL